MRVLVAGAAGLIGSAVCARLHADGWQVVAAVRNLSATARRVTADKLAVIEFEGATPQVWAEHLTGVTAVVNCAGVLQDSARDSTGAVHRDGAAALFEACEAAGVRRVIHFSAIGVDREGLSDFSRTKREGEAALMARDLDWVILRPSVVLGRPAYGGSALFRALAALPWLPRNPNAGPLQVVQLDEVVETVVRLIRPEAPARVALDVAGPERLTFEEVVAAYRRWFGWKPARLVQTPRLLMGLAYAMGDAAGRLGWRPPIRSTARKEIVRGAVGDPKEWIGVTGIQPAPLSEALARTPATVQERWFAQLYLLKAPIFATFALFWIATGLISLTSGYDIGEAMMREGGAGPFSGPSVVAGALADICIGLAIAFRRTTRLGLWAALAISLFYALAGTLILPRLWEDPLGPMLKIWPILCLNLVCFAILEDR